MNALLLHFDGEPNERVQFPGRLLQNQPIARLAQSAGHREGCGPCVTLCQCQKVLGRGLTASYLLATCIVKQDKPAIIAKCNR